MPLLVDVFSEKSITSGGGKQRQQACDSKQAELIDLLQQPADLFNSFKEKDVSVLRLSQRKAHCPRSLVKGDSRFPRGWPGFGTSCAVSAAIAKW